MTILGGRAAGGLLIAFAGACQCNASGSLTSASSKVGVTPLSMSFGSVYVGASPRQSFSVFNAGEASDQFSLSLADGGSGFALLDGGGLFPIVGGGSQALWVVFAPTEPGPASGTVDVRWSNGSAAVALDATALAQPPCNPDGPCSGAAFDPNTGVCSQSQLADGTACDAGLVCLQDTQCLAGQCLGQPTSCPGDACTIASCVEGEGCHYQDNSARCQGTNPCEIYSCDPKSGCQSTAAPDGTPCASADACTTASVCVQGRCVGVAVPNGTPCHLWWDPCASDAACDAGVCDSPTADQLKPGDVMWTNPTAGGWISTPPAVDDGGNIYYQAGPGTELEALDRCGNLLWESTASRGIPMLDGEQLVTLDDPQNPRFVQGVATSNGAVEWSTDLYATLGFCPPRATCDAGVQIPYTPTVSLAMSNQELIYVLVSAGGAYQSLTALLRDGSLLWTQQLTRQATYDQIACDTAGNVYATWAEGSDGSGDGGVDVLDSSGHLGFSVGLPAQPLDLAIGASFFVGLGPFAGMVWSSGGGVLYPLPAAPGATIWNQWDPPVIDASGTLYYAPSDDGPQLATALGRAGSTLWSAGGGVGPRLTVSMVVDDADELLIGSVTPSGASVTALNLADGGFLWSHPSPALTAGSPGIALTDTGAVLMPTVPSGVTAIFAGRHKTSPTAQWPRWGGDNRNRNCPPPAGQP
ncbi:MAG: outer membrane protein assembly factor BamB family protein [Myxococcales bacterium]